MQTEKPLILVISSEGPEPVQSATWRPDGCVGHQAELWLAQGRWLRVLLDSQRAMALGQTKGQWMCPLRHGSFEAPKIKVRSLSIDLETIPKLLMVSIIAIVKK